MKPYCFVLMPFGRKPDETGALIDFDAVYHSLIEPAIRDAELDPIRADEELVGGSIHKPMFERLMLCDYAVADLTTANPNVLYELGVRHAVRPWSTTILFRDGTRLPFDLAPLRAIPYRPEALDAARKVLSERLHASRDQHEDSPVYQFLSGLPRPILSHEATDVFRERVEYSRSLKRRLADARALGRERGIVALRSIKAEFSTLTDVEVGVLLDLLLSLRAVGAFEELVRLYHEFPGPLQRNRMAREQLGFALNRLGRSTEAEQVLLDVITREGPSPETNGLLGRVYKDRWEAAIAAGDTLRGRGFLRKAIDTYLAGFECDWRDYYPGVNAVTLMQLLEPIDPRLPVILPVVRYSAQRHAARGPGGYWELATLVELAVLAGEPETATSHLEEALAAAEKLGETFAPRTTARNLALIQRARESRGERASWIAALVTELEKLAVRLEGGAP